MAAVFGAQNAGDSDCLSMALGFDGPAFKAASGLVFESRAQPSGHTEPVLRRWRREVKVGMVMKAAAAA